MTADLSNFEKDFSSRLGSSSPERGLQTQKVAYPAQIFQSCD